jgi:hypothetical protein
MTMLVAFNFTASKLVRWTGLIYAQITCTIPRLLSFISWVETERTNVTIADGGCFNPYTQLSVTAEGGQLLELKPPKTIGGCVPQVRPAPINMGSGWSVG